MEAIASTCLSIEGTCLSFEAGPCGVVNDQVKLSGWEGLNWFQ